MQLLDGDTCPLSFFTLLHTDAHQAMVILVDIQDDRVRTFLFVAGGQRDFITAFSAQGRFLELGFMLCCSSGVGTLTLTSSLAFM